MDIVVVLLAVLTLAVLCIPGVFRRLVGALLGVLALAAVASLPFGRILEVLGGHLEPFGRAFVAAPWWYVGGLVATVVLLLVGDRRRARRRRAGSGAEAEP